MHTLPDILRALFRTNNSMGLRVRVRARISPWGGERDEVA